MSQWHAVRKSLPPEGTLVLVATPCLGHQLAVYRPSPDPEDYPWRMHGSEHFTVPEVTHWHELPALPGPGRKS